MNKINGTLILTGIVVIIGFILLLQTPYRTAVTKSKKQFKTHPDFSELLYQPGAEVYADQIAVCIQPALKTIEEKVSRPFSKKFNIYVCSNQKDFDEFIAARSPYPIRGTVLRGNIYISPAAFNFKGKDTHKETLLHELSHLYFRQQLGFIRDRQIPQWFREGFADYVSGAGGEGIEEPEAISYILNGRHFVLETEGKIFSSFSNSLNNLSGPMYHQQVKIFVSYLAEQDSLKFKSFVMKIQDGEPFEKSFNESMPADIQGMWEEFISDLMTTGMHGEE